MQVKTKMRHKVERETEGVSKKHKVGKEPEEGSKKRIPSWPCSLGERGACSKLERDQNQCDVLEVLGEFKCDTGMSVENVSLFHFSPNTPPTQ